MPACHPPQAQSLLYPAVLAASRCARASRAQRRTLENMKNATAAAVAPNSQACGRGDIRQGPLRALHADALRQLPRPSQPAGIPRAPAPAAQQAHPELRALLRRGQRNAATPRVPRCRGSAAHHPAHRHLGDGVVPKGHSQPRLQAAEQRARAVGVEQRWRMAHGACSKKVSSMPQLRNAGEGGAALPHPAAACAPAAHQENAKRGHA